MSRPRIDDLALPLVLVALTVFAAWVLPATLMVLVLPLLLFAAVWSAWRSFRTGVGAVLFLALLADNPQSRPMEGQWESPLYPAGELLYTNLHLLIGIEAFRFSLLEVLVLGFVLIALMKRSAGGGAGTLSKGGKTLAAALGIAFIAVIVLEGWGLVRGGDFRQSLWQIRQILWLPALAWLCIHAFRRRGDIWFLSGIIMIAGVLRAFTGFAYYAMSRADGHFPTYVTSHSDSVLWLVGVATCLLYLMERPSQRAWILCAAYIPVASLAMLLNERRLAFVCLGAAFLVVLFVVRTQVLRRLRRTALIASPVLIVYIFAGWNIDHRVFAPVRTFQSLLDESDASNHSRHVENFNLVYTLLESPLVGHGFGHPYSEHIETYRIDHVFEQYLYMPHNSVLWMLAAGGIIGFLALWAFIPLVIWLAAKCYRNAVAPTERVAALTSISVVVAYLIQAWGDIGAHSWMVTLILAAYVGIVGNLDRHVHARQFHTPDVDGAPRKNSDAMDVAEGVAC